MIRHSFAGAVLFGLASCAAPGEAPEIAQSTGDVAAAGARITDEAEFRRVVVDRTLVADQEAGYAEFTISSDGTLDGTWTPAGASEPANVLAGAWSWEDGLWCREVDGTATDFPYECQEIYVEDGVYWSVSPDGRESPRYTIT